MPRNPLPLTYFNKSGDVFIADGVTGLHTTKVRGRLPCRLDKVNSEAAGPDREYDLQRRVLKWDPSYQMPVFCQVAIGGVRWAPVPNTFALYESPELEPIYRACDVTEQTEQYPGDV